MDYLLACMCLDVRFVLIHSLLILCTQHFLSSTANSDKLLRVSKLGLLLTLFFFLFYSLITFYSLYNFCENIVELAFLILKS